MMTFRVGPWEYVAVIQGQGCRASFEDRCIYLGVDIPPGRRREALLHELWHCWEWHVPAPRDEEDRARLGATVLEGMLRDLESQGGERALRSMRPTPAAREIRYEAA